MKRQTQMYEERERDLERRDHKRKLEIADKILEEAEKRLKSARDLYQERLRNDG